MRNWRHNGCLGGTLALTLALGAAVMMGCGSTDTNAAQEEPAAAEAVAEEPTEAATELEITEEAAAEATEMPAEEAADVEVTDDSELLPQLDTALDYNDDAYAPEAVSRREGSVLEGKTFYWLGSSVFQGAHSHKTDDQWDGVDAVPEYIAARDGAICVKDTKSGTLFGSKTYERPPVDAENSYVNRLIRSEQFDQDAEIDAFFVQVSTNDAQYSADDPDLIGEVSAADIVDRDSFDLETSLGSVEYIISYIHDTWDCPIYFVTGTYYGADLYDGTREVVYNKGENYARLLEGIYAAVDKWDSMDGYSVSIIDQYNDEELNNIDDDLFNYYMTDPIHPSRAGYLFWWTPNIEAYLEEAFAE